MVCDCVVLNYDILNFGIESEAQEDSPNILDIQFLATDNRISGTDIRPLPKVSQITLKVPRIQKQHNRIGRTRLLTDTPETNAIAFDRQRPLEKLNKVRRRLQPPKPTQGTVKKDQSRPLGKKPFR